jgi:hypothetical protein
VEQGYSYAPGRFRLTCQYGISGRALPVGPGQLGLATPFELEHVHRSWKHHSMVCLPHVKPLKGHGQHVRACHDCVLHRVFDHHTRAFAKHHQHPSACLERNRVYGATIISLGTDVCNVNEEGSRCVRSPRRYAQHTPVWVDALPFAEDHESIGPR